MTGADDPARIYPFAPGDSPTSRGFSDHEKLPGTGLINMNARLYDPEIGRMLSADDYTPTVYYSQVLNRYSYCGNNPLSLTDMTGNSWFSSLMDDWFGDAWRVIVAVVAAVTLQHWALPALGFSETAAAFTTGFIIGGVSGGDLGSAIKGGVIAGFVHLAGSALTGGGSSASAAGEAASSTLPTTAVHAANSAAGQYVELDVLVVTASRISTSVPTVVSAVATETIVVTASRKPCPEKPTAIAAAETIGETIVVTASRNPRKSSVITAGLSLDIDIQPFLNCLKECAIDVYGLDTLFAAGLTLSGQRLFDYPRGALGGTERELGTSLASTIARKVFPGLVGRAVGRMVPYLGWGLVVQDVYNIGNCTAQCMSGER